MTASQSVHEQPTKGLSGFQEALNVTSHRVEMPRQNSDPTSENPPLPTRIEKFDRSSWLRQEEDIPPKVTGWPAFIIITVMVIIVFYWYYYLYSRPFMVMRSTRMSKHGPCLFSSLLIPKLRLGLSFITSDLHFPRNGGSYRLSDLETSILYPELELSISSIPSYYFTIHIKK